MTRLLIAGATGLVGKLTLDLALTDARVDRVIALTRRPVASHEKLDNVVIDFAAMPADAAWWSVDGVVSALGTTRAKTQSPADYRTIDYGYPLTIARHARAHGATRFALVSSLGADPHSRFAYPRLKGELESAVATLGYPSLSILRPGMIDGPRAEERRSESTMISIFRLLGPVMPSKWRISPAGLIAAATLESAIAGPPGVRVMHNDDMG